MKIFGHRKKKVKQSVLDVIILDNSGSDIAHSSSKEEELFNVELSLKTTHKENENIPDHDVKKEDANDLVKTKTRSKISKLFGDTKKKKSKRADSHVTKTLIAVDEKEKYLKIEPREFNNLSSDSLNLVRMNSKMSNNSRLSRRSRKTKFGRRFKSNSDVVAQTKSRQKKNQLPRMKSVLSGARLSNLVSSDSIKKNKEDVLNFTLSLDFINGISCINHGNEVHEESPKVIISYFNKSIKTGTIKRYDIESLPMKKIYSSSCKKELYQAKFDGDEDMNGMRSFTIAVGMTPNSKKSSGYDMKEFHLQVGLKKGREIIKLGNAILPLHGDESGMKMSVPFGNIKFVTSFTGNKSRVSQVSKIITEGLEAVAFPSDLKRRYVLENSTLLIETNLNDNELESMVIFPSIKEKVSNLSNDGGEEQEYDFADAPSFKKGRVNLNRRFQSSMTELLNLESKSSNERQFSRSNHDIGESSSGTCTAECDESTEVFNKNLNDENSGFSYSTIKADFESLVLQESYDKSSVVQESYVHSPQYRRTYGAEFDCSSEEESDEHGSTYDDENTNYDNDSSIVSSSTDSNSSKSSVGSDCSY